jgi:hypothetical protein
MRSHLLPQLQHDVPLGLQEPQLWLMPAAAHSLDVAREAIDLANAYGGTLDRAQEVALETCMATTESGHWAAATFGNAVPRQNGKGDSIQWRELYGATQLNERIAHTAHETPTAIQAFQRMEALIQGHADLRRLVKRLRYANGEQAIEFKSGAFIIYRTRTGSGLRGWDEIDLLVVDEAQHAQEEHLAAIAPTQTVAANPQTYFAGSAGFSHSVVWWRMRLDAIKGVAGPFGWVEHTSERLRIDERGRLVSEAPDPTDEVAWVESNPAYGYRIGGGGEGSRRYLDGELRKLGPDLFLRERLGVWDAMPTTDGPEPKIPADAWQATATTVPHDVAPGACVFAFDVHDGWSSICVAAGTLSASYVEVVAHQSGDGWLPRRLVELTEKWKPIAIGLDGGNGPAVAVLGVVREQFEAAGLDPDLVKPLTSAQYKAACGSFLHAVTDRSLSRPVVAPDQLDNAAVIAPERRIGDAFVWDRRTATAPLSPLVAATVACSLLGDKAAPTAPEAWASYIDL